jgi:hypothetical protein
MVLSLLPSVCNRRVPFSRFNCLFILFGRTSEITSPWVMILQVWEAALVA